MNKKSRRLLWVAACLVVLLACASEGAGAPAPESDGATELTISPPQGIVLTPAANHGSIARRHLEALSETIGARWPGTPEETQTAGYVQAAFEEMGYKAELQTFSFTDEGDSSMSANIITVKEGLSSREMIVGAHYDSSDEADGADDNASGVAVMLEAAERVKDLQTPYTIRFIAFGAEESDLNGSSYFVDHMSQADIENTIGMINLDSLIAGDRTYVYGDAGPESMRDWILQVAKERGFELERRTAKELDSPDGTPCNCADYSPFQAAGIPFAYFEATNWDLGEEDGMTQTDMKFGAHGAIRHTAYDTVSYIDKSFPGRIDDHLSLFVTLLVNTLTAFEVPNM